MKHSPLRQVPHLCRDIEPFSRMDQAYPGWINMNGKGGAGKMMDIFQFTQGYREFLSTGKQVMDSVEAALSGMQEHLQQSDIEIKRLCWFELHLVCLNTVNVYFRCVFSSGKYVLEAGVLSHEQTGMKHNAIATKDLIQELPDLKFEGQGQKDLATWLVRDVAGEVMQKVLSDFKLIPCHQTHAFYLVDKDS